VGREKSSGSSRRRRCARKCTDVLVIDDGRPLRLMFARMLSRAAFRCQAVDCLADARAQLREHRPDLLVVDDWFVGGCSGDSTPSAAGPAHHY
jgi:DNA-binding NtrC family response regulator